MKKVLAFVAVAAFLMTVGCGALGPAGFIFTSVKNPGQFDVVVTGNLFGDAFVDSGDVGF